MRVGKHGGNCEADRDGRAVGYPEDAESRFDAIGPDATVSALAVRRTDATAIG
jgi:hypothetical protein